MPRPLVLHHGGGAEGSSEASGGCPDGFGAALAAWTVLGDDAEYRGVARFNEYPDDVARRDVYVLDFTFTREVMERLGREAASLTVLDHHASSTVRLAGYRPLCCGKVHLDVERSGAVLAWEHFHPGKPLPYLYQCIQSRDLWRWDVPGDRAFLSWLDTQPMTFTAWRQVLQATPEELSVIGEQGAAMEVKYQALCREMAEQAKPLVLDGHEGLVANVPHAFASAVGHLLYERCGTFGLIWSITPDRMLRCSLRSKAPFDARLIAEKFGGGGHPQAAGFALPLEHLTALLQGRLDAPDSVPVSR